MRIVSSDFSRRLCAFSVLSARILNATSASGMSSATIGLRAEPPHRLQPVVAVGRPVAIVVADDDDRIEEAAELFDHRHQPLDVRIRRVALKRRRLDAIDRQRRRAARACRRTDRDRRRAPRRRRARRAPPAIGRAGARARLRRRQADRRRRLLLSPDCFLFGHAVEISASTPSWRSARP